MNMNKSLEMLMIAVPLIYLLSLLIYKFVVISKMNKSGDKTIQKHSKIFLGLLIANILLAVVNVVLVSRNSNSKMVKVLISLFNISYLFYVIGIGLKLRRNDRLRKDGSALVVLTILPLALTPLMLTLK